MKQYKIYLEDTIIIIKGVPAKVCTGCGEQYFDDETFINKEAEDSVKKGGNIAKIAKEQLEKETGKKVISDKNANSQKFLVGSSGYFFISY